MNSIIDDIQHEVKVTRSVSIDKDLADWLADKAKELKAKSESSLLNAILKYARANELV
jgi:hypothetical protein